MTQPNPTDALALDFDAFVASRQAERDQHHDGDVPDYAFAMDWSIRRKLDHVRPLRLLAQSIANSVVPMQRALYEMRGLAVGPSQLPHIHAMGVRCAETLGIGIPQIFVVQEHRLNAWTFATDDIDQIIVLTSGLVEALDAVELLTVIGHECGHIHNRHVVYNTLWEILTNTLARSLFAQVLRKLGPSVWVAALAQALMAGSLGLVFQRWHRCAEITCDRAALICSADLDAAKRIHAKLAMGHLGHVEGVNADVYAEQLKTFDASSLRLMELTMTHPLGPKRVQAIERFASCEVLHRWRPQLRIEPPLSKQTVDDEIATLFL